MKIIEPAITTQLLAEPAMLPKDARPHGPKGQGLTAIARYREFHIVPQAAPGGCWISQPIRDGAHMEDRTGQYWTDVLDLVDCGVLIVDKAGIVHEANSLAGSLIQAPSSLVGSNVADLLGGSLQKLVDERRGNRAVAPLPLPDGRTRPAEACAQYSPDHQMTVISLRRPSTESEAESRARRHERLATAEKMAAKLAHELRNPLSSVLAGMQTLEKDECLSSEARFISGIILDEIRAVDDIINRLLQSVRSDLSDPQLMRLGTVVQEACDVVGLTAAEKSIALEVVEGPADLLVAGDRLALRRALENLLRNGVNACQAGDRISAGWREIGPGEKAGRFPGYSRPVACVFGEDSGAGMPNGLTDSSVFKPFTSLKKAAVGLGLSVAQEIIENHGGAILLRGRSAGGSIFEVFLPAIDPATSGGQQVDLHDCQFGATDEDLLCWALKGKIHRDESGTWPARCLQCPVYGMANLHLFVDRDSEAGKED